MTRRTVFSSLVALLVTAGTLLAGPAQQAHALSQSADSTWTTNGYVFATAQFGNVLFIGGTFTQVRSLPPQTPGGTIVHVQNLAAIDMTTGAAIPSFHPMVAESEFASGKKAGVQALAVVDDRLYVGGQFNEVDGALHHDIAAILIDPATMTGTVDAGFNPVVGVPGSLNQNKNFVYKILPSPAGLYVGGVFTRVSNYLSSKVVRLNYDGTVNTAFRTKGVNGAVRDMAFSPDGQTIFAVGAFGLFNGPRDRASCDWTLDGCEHRLGHPHRRGHRGIAERAAPERHDVLERGGDRDATVRRVRANAELRGGLPARQRRRGNPRLAVLHLREHPDDRPVCRRLVAVHRRPLRDERAQPDRSCPGGTKYLKNLAILHTITGLSTPSVDCSFVPQFWSPSPNGGVWEIQVTPTAIWAGGMFRTINGINQWGIARFTL